MSGWAQRDAARAEDDAERAEDDARIATLELALRRACEAWRSRIPTETPWCLRCGADWFGKHVATCPIGDGLRLLDDKART